MIYSTPPKEFDGITTGLRLLESAMDLIALADEEKHRKAELYQGAALLVHDAYLAIQSAAGNAINQDAEAKQQEGRQYCILCQRWRPLHQMMQAKAGYGNDKQGALFNHWWRCRNCQEPDEADSEDERDPFETDDE